MCLHTKSQKQAWCSSFLWICRPTKGCFHSPHQMLLPLALNWRSWRYTCAFEPDTLTSDFQWCGCDFPAHTGSNIQMLGRLQYGNVPHIRPSVQGMSSSYPWGSFSCCAPILPLDEDFNPLCFLSTPLCSGTRWDERVLLLYFRTVVPMVENILE